jgi:hypothetical protein
MAKYFLDTEFMEDGRTIELLSIGIVREDGTEYYAVSADADRTRANDWVTENVLPFLGTPLKSRTQIRDEVREFLMFDQRPEVWAWYGAYDWVALCQLFGRVVDLPKGMPKFCRDVRQLCEDVGNPNIPKQTTKTHNALNDARWTKEAWAFCNAKRVPIWT